VNIYLIRHGQSEGNAGNVFQGTLEFPLTTLGREQASAMGRWLAAQGVAPLRVYSSPQARAHSTAELIHAQLRTPSGEPPALLLEPDIREYHAGELSGKTLSEIEASYPDYVTRPLDERGCMAAWGGESYEEVQSRLIRFIARLREAHAEGEDVVAVGHGGSLYQLIKLWCGWPVPRHFFTRITNCCCFKLGLREVAGHTVAELCWMLPVELVSAMVHPGVDSPPEG